MPSQDELDEIVAARNLIARAARARARDAIKASDPAVRLAGGAHLRSRRSVTFALEPASSARSGDGPDDLDAHAERAIGAQTARAVLFGTAPTPFVGDNAAFEKAALSRSRGSLVRLGLSPRELVVALDAVEATGVSDEGLVSLFGRSPRYFAGETAVPVPQPGQFGEWFFRDNEGRRYARADGAGGFEGAARALRRTGATAWVGFVQLPFWTDEERRQTGDIARLPTVNSRLIVEGNSKHYVAARNAFVIVEHVEEFEGRVASAVVVLSVFSAAGM